MKKILEEINIKIEENLESLMELPEMRSFTDKERRHLRNIVKKALENGSLFTVQTLSKHYPKLTNRSILLHNKETEKFDAFCSL